MGDEKIDIVVTGDYGEDQIIWIEEMPQRPSDLRDEWVNANLSCQKIYPAAIRTLKRHLGSMKDLQVEIHEVTPKEKPRSITILTCQKRRAGNRDGENQEKWRIERAIFAGNRKYESGKIEELAR